jgi:hypothetical protein
MGIDFHAKPSGRGCNPISTTGQTDKTMKACPFGNKKDARLGGWWCPNRVFLVQ